MGLLCARVNMCVCGKRVLERVLGATNVGEMRRQLRASDSSCAETQLEPELGVGELTFLLYLIWRVCQGPAECGAQQLPDLSQRRLAAGGHRELQCSV